MAVGRIHMRALFLHTLPSRAGNFDDRGAYLQCSIRFIFCRIRRRPEFE